MSIPGETHFIPEVAAARRAASDPSDCFVQTVTSHRHWKDFNLNPDALRQRIRLLDSFSLSNALRTFYRLYSEGHGKPRWGDKTPWYLFRMRLIQELLPEARFVHVIRDGRDVALSIKDLWFGPDSIVAVAEWWVARVRAARGQRMDLRYYTEVRYEDLVLETDHTLRSVCEFIDLPWDPAMLNYHERADGRLSEVAHDLWVPEIRRVIGGEDRTAIFGLASKPPQTSRVGRWKAEMDRADQERFESVAGDLLRELGYD